MLSNPWFDNKILRNRMKWLVRDYDRMRKELRELETRDAFSRSEYPSGMPSSGRRSDVTQRLAIEDMTKLQKMRDEISAIEAARIAVPDIYREAVWEYTTTDVSKVSVTYKFSISARTLHRQTNAFYYIIAKRLGLVA